MRPAGRGELESLYFDYPHFEPPVRDPAVVEERARVMIVGAGPVGLVAALALAREGVASILLERKDTFNDGSRAICIARQSYHILERIGAVDRFVDKSYGWTTGRSFYRGRQILEFRMPHGADEKFLPMYNLEQQYIEQFLWEAVRESGLIDLRWQSEATAIDENPDGVTVSVRDPKGDYRVKAEWLLAADGARSAVRALCGLRLRGDNHEGRYVIADVQMEHDYPTVRRALFDPASNPGRTVLIHRQPDNIWRIDYQLEDGEDENTALSEAHVRAMVGAILKEIGHDKPWALEWWSIYSANTLALDDYRRGRILFIGDSAHVVPIFGVRGLNNGLADAENAAWKLARVLRGEAGEALLDSYSPERRGATLDVFANATKSARFMTPPTQGWRLVRDAALALAVDHDFARPFANPRQMTPYTYSGSPATCADEDGFSGGPPPGAVAVNVMLGDGTWLSDHLGIGFTGVLFSPRAGVAAAMGAALARLDPRFRLLVIGAGGEGVLADTDGRIARAYGAQPGSFYLLRPDMHVAGRLLHGDPGRLVASMKTILWGKEA